MIQRIALILVFSGFSQLAHAAPEGFEECRRGKNLLGSILDENNVVLEMDEDMLLRSGNTYLKRAGWWRKYWGTAVYVTLNQSGQERILKSGTQIPLRSVVRMGGDSSAGLTSSFIIFRVENDDASGIEMITIDAQPYSNIPVRRFEKTVRGTLYCRAKN